MQHYTSAALFSAIEVLGNIIVALAGIHGEPRPALLGISKDRWEEGKSYHEIQNQSSNDNGSSGGAHAVSLEGTFRYT